MKTLLAIVCVLNLVGAFIALVASPILIAPCLGAALIAGAGYAILERLDAIAEGSAAAQKVLEQIRDQGRIRNPAVDDPTRLAEAERLLAAGRK